MSSAVIGLAAFFAMLAISQAVSSDALQHPHHLQSSCVIAPVTIQNDDGSESTIGHAEKCPLDDKCQRVKLSLESDISKCFGDDVYADLCKDERFGELV